MALYLVICTNNTNVGKCKINKINYAINLAHIVSHRMNPCLDPWLKLCLYGCIRKLSKPVCKKAPITADMSDEESLTFL